MTLEEALVKSKLVYAAAWLVGFKWGLVCGFHKGYTEGLVRAARKRGKEYLATNAILKYYKLMEQRGYPALNI